MLRGRARLRQNKTLIERRSRANAMCETRRVCAATRRLTSTLAVTLRDRLAPARTLHPVASRREPHSATNTACIFVGKDWWRVRSGAPDGARQVETQERYRPRPFVDANRSGYR
jgi:hypothetical protein